MRRLSVAVIAMAGLCALSGCGTAGNAASPAATPASPAATSPPAAAAPTAAAKVVVDEHSNGRAVHVAAGTTVVVVLHNTYWHFGPPPAGGMLAEVGQPSAAPRRPGAGGCMPGMGCGTVTATFRAVGAGTAVIRASRTTCGEALRCRAGQGRFAVTIVVAG
jgi:hypothetical protein